MKKIIVITQYVSMPGEKSNGRFRYLISMIDKTKFDVELITTNFSHRDKEHRSYNYDKEIDYKFTMLNEPGYKKNVSFKRFYSHYVFSKNLEKYLKSIEKPDVIYCAVPSLDVAKVAAKFAEKNNIRFIIDVQDLWPEAFKLVFKVPIISDLIFYPMKKQADYVYSRADDIVAVSDTYAERAAMVNKKYKNKISVFLGTELDYFDKLKKENEIVPFDDNIRIAYIGTLGHSYDIRVVIDAIKILNDKGLKNILFVVMGNGPLKEQFEEYAKEKNVNCEFTGRLDYNEMVGKLCSCDIAVNPIKKGSAGSIINKVGDYAAAGLPVLNTQECEEYRKIVEEYKIGFNIENESPIEFAEKIKELYENKKSRKDMGANNRMLAEEKFDRKNTYLQIKKIIEEG